MTLTTKDNVSRRSSHIYIWLISGVIQFISKITNLMSKSRGSGLNSIECMEYIKLRISSVLILAEALI